jgi:hypothetical protein
MLHGGAGRIPVDPAYRNNGLKTTDFLGGENVSSKDFMLMHVPSELFLSALVLDGTLERFPLLRGGCIEQAAIVGGSMAQTPRCGAGSFVRTEPGLALPMRASHYARPNCALPRFRPHP